MLIDCIWLFWFLRVVDLGLNVVTKKRCRFSNVLLIMLKKRSVVCVFDCLIFWFQNISIMLITNLY